MVTALAALAALVLTGVPARADAAPSRAGAEIDLGARLRMLRQLEANNAPDFLIDALTTDDARVRRGRSVYAYPTRDVSGDGKPEVIESDVRYSITIDRSQSINSIVSEEFTTVLRVRDAQTGRMHWKKRYDDYVFASPGMIGDPARKGIILTAGVLSFFGGSTGQRYLEFFGLRGDNGKTQWRKEYASVAASYEYTTQVVADTPVSFSFVQARKDEATEVLIGLATLTETFLAPVTAVTRTVLLSAADGSDVVHPIVDVGVDWLPIPDAIPDSDGDGLDDYVVINDKGIDPGNGQEPPQIGGIVQVRRGLDGTALWTEGGLEFRWFAFTLPLANVLGDGRRDFGVMTFNRGLAESVIPSVPFLPTFLLERDVEVAMLFDSGGGNHAWTRRGTWIHSPGDLDGRGLDDVVVERLHFLFRRNGIRYTRLAYPGVGKMIWRHELEWQGPECPLDECFGGGGGGIGPAGDVHPDSIDDRIVFMAADNGVEDETRTYVLDGNSKRIQISSGGDLYPLYVPIDGRGDDMMTTVINGGGISLRARDGEDGRTLWEMKYGLPRDLLPKEVGAFADGFHLDRDPCGDVLVDVFSNRGTYYAVVDGRDASIVWSEWRGDKGFRPHLKAVRDSNRAC